MTTPSTADPGPSMVTGIFPDGRCAEAAFAAATQLGYGKDDINVVMADDTRKRYFAEDRPVDTGLARKSAEGGELGGPKGGRISLLLPVVAAVGTTIALSGVGLVVAGPVAAAIAAAGTTGLAAGLIGALADWGVPEKRLRHYQVEIHDGGILLAVKSATPADAREIARRWVDLGGRHVHA
jgi:hypothetical protein